MIGIVCWVLGVGFVGVGFFRGGVVCAHRADRRQVSRVLVDDEAFSASEETSVLEGTGGGGLCPFWI